MNKYLKDQRGIAMVLELVLVVAVLAIVGVALYGRYQAGKTTPSQTVVNTPSTAATGSVDSAVNALTQGSASENVASGQEDGEIPATDTSNGTAQNLGGSYNENSF